MTRIGGTVPTWQERMPAPRKQKYCAMNCSGGERPCEDCDTETIYDDHVAARDAEIADLRAALAAAPLPQVQSKALDWMAQPTETGLYFYAESSAFAPGIVNIVSPEHADGGLLIERKDQELGMGFTGTTYADPKLRPGKWSKITVPVFPAPKKRPSAFSCCKARPNTYSLTCDEFCGNAETCFEVATDQKLVTPSGALADNGSGVES